MECSYIGTQCRITILSSAVTITQEGRGDSRNETVDGTKRTEGDNPTIGHLTLLIYKMTMDEFPQQGKSASVKMPTITNRHNDRVVGYSRL